MTKISDAMEDAKNYQPPEYTVKLFEVNKDNIDKHLQMFISLTPSGFVLNNENERIIRMLICYFNGNDYPGYDLNKGIMLTGLYGSGKTTIMETMQKYLCHIRPFNKNVFRNTSTDEIYTHLKNNDDTQVFTYNYRTAIVAGKEPKPLHICINEFGQKFRSKHYGSDVGEYFERFLMVRYEIYQQYKKLTHATTNFDTQQLKDVYPPKLIDRFKEMFNFIHLPGKSFRN